MLILRRKAGEAIWIGDNQHHWHVVFLGENFLVDFNDRLAGFDYIALFFESRESFAIGFNRIDSDVNQQFNAIIKGQTKGMTSWKHDPSINE